MVPTREDILEEIRRTSVDGRALGRERFRAATGIKESDWLGRHWARWSEAVAEAGCTVQTLNPRLADEVVLRPLALLVRALGRMPVVAELKIRARTEPGFPSHNTFRRFGDKEQLEARLRLFCLDRDDLHDVAALCSPADGQADSMPDDAPSLRPEDGFVYLIRAGRFYKIGRTKGLQRRARELAIQLPERAEIVHHIKTDDPVGIERYWHARFAAQRQNGEWFALGAEDVRAFRRRKFM